MKRIVIAESVTDDLLSGEVVSCPARIDGEMEDVTIELASDNHVVFPAVWLNGDRFYDAEVWRGDSLVFAVPPESPDVVASFEEHERRRGQRAGTDADGQARLETRSTM